ncbi:hypothetical protein SLE2022_361880 [Rubroshorea leprosula]
MPASYEISFVASLIQKCTAVTCLKKARQLHALILTNAVAPVCHQSPYLHNNLLSMYAHCNSLEDAKQVFDKVPKRNLVSYNALIAAYSRAPDHADKVFGLITQMVFECMRPNGSTFTSLLQAVSSVEDPLMGSSLHAQVVKFGFLDDVRVQTSLLGMYSNCGDLESASKAFGCISDKDAVAWNSIILGNLKNDNIEQGLRIFCEMVSSGVIPTQFTYSMILNGCSRMGNHRFGQVIHAQVIISNTEADLPLQNALLDMYCNCGDLETAFYVFSRIENPNLVSWNSIISGFSENGDGMMALHLFIRLKSFSLPKPDEYTFASVISAASALLASNYGKPLHAQVIKAGFDLSVFVATTLVSMYFKNGDAESAEMAFKRILKKDVVLWTEMIMGFSRMADGEGAMRLFLEMCQEGHMIDSFALSGVISACADLAMLKQGEMIHTLAIKTGQDVEMSVCGSLVDMYAKNGDLHAAQSIFFPLSNPDIKCWNAMVGAYSHHGMAEEALKLFEEILKHELGPDHVTFLSLLSACSHGGFIEKGKLFWNYMKEDGCVPGPKHYSCMVSLLGRAGLLDEAEEIINESPYGKDHLELWRTLLSFCVTSRNLEKGIHAAEQVLKLDPKDNGTHILLSNLYAVTERWEGVAEMRRKIRGLMLEKGPGLSWIEAKNNIHVFTSGDQSHRQADEAQAELQRLRENMIKSVEDELDLNIAA